MRIYLDWNCITHLKDEGNAEVREYIMYLKNFCVFPFSDAHFADLMRSYREDGSNEYFNQDMELLESVCEKNLMLYIKEKDIPMLFKANPMEYLEKKGLSDFNITESLKSGGLSGLIQNLTTDFPRFSQMLKSRFQSVELNISNSPFFPHCSNLLEASDVAVKAFYNQKDINRELTKRCFSKQDKMLSNISGATAENVKDLIDAYLKASENEDVDALLSKSQNGHDVLVDFIQKYLFFDFCGFRSDKKHTLDNIGTDAKHAFYGSYCDIYVTNDTKSSDKCRVVYKDNGIRTIVIGLKDFNSFMENKTKEIVNLTKFYDECCTSKIAKIPDDNSPELKVYPRYFDTPLFGFFNMGFPIIDNRGNEYVIFKKVLGAREGVFYSEIDCFINLFKIVPDCDFKKRLEEYRMSLLCGNGKSTPIVVNFENFTLKFVYDYDDARLPMIIVSKNN